MSHRDLSHKRSSVKKSVGHDDYTNPAVIDRVDFTKLLVPDHLLAKTLITLITQLLLLNMVTADEVHACRNELLQLRSEVQKVQVEYQAIARNRVALQSTMARMVQTVQDRCSKNDVPLVEDVIVIALQTETAARCDKLPPAPPPINPASQPTGRQTASAQEALTIYQQQIATMQLEHDYRAELLAIEQKMAQIYDHGILEVVETVREFGRSQVIDEIKRMADGAVR